MTAYAFSILIPEIDVLYLLSLNWLCHWHDTFNRLIFVTFGFILTCSEIINFSTLR